MHKNRATCGFLSVTVIITLLVMALGVVAVILFAGGSLGEKMNLLVNQPATKAPEVVEPKVIVVTATPAPQKQSPVATTTPTTAPPAVKDQGTCGTRGTLLLLFVGADVSGGVWPPGADSVRVIKVDYDQKKVTVVAFPRDLWLKTAGLKNQNIDETRLGMAYHYMMKETMGSDKHRITAATTLVGQVLYDTFGIAPQTYFTLQMDNLPEMVDAIDGVDIYNPTAFTSDYQVHFPVGQLHLDGKLAREFVRTYHPGGDDSRRERQNLFVDALQSNVIDAGLAASIPDLYKTFDKAITTDLTPKMIGELACMVEEVPREQIELHEIAGDLVTPINVGQGIPALVPKVDEVKAKLVEWLEK